MYHYINNIIIVKRKIYFITINIQLLRQANNNWKVNKPISLTYQKLSRVVILDFNREDKLWEIRDHSKIQMFDIHISFITTTCYYMLFPTALSRHPAYTYKEHSVSYYWGDEW